MSKNISFKQKCKNAGMDMAHYNKACAYRRYYPQLTDDEVISHYINYNNNININMYKNDLFNQKCKKYGIKYANAYWYKKNHPELTDDEIIDYYMHRKTKSFTDKCRDAGVNISTARNYKFEHKDMTDEQVIEKVKNKRRNKEKYKIGDTLKKVCESEGISYANALYYRKRYPDLSIDELIIKIKDTQSNKSETLKNRCIELGISYSSAISYKNKYTEASEDEIINHFLEYNKSIENSNDINRKCRDIGVSRAQFNYIRERYSCSDDSIFEFLSNKNNGIINKEILGNPNNPEQEIFKRNNYAELRKLCKEHKINERDAILYKTRHNKLTDEQVIDYYLNRKPSFRSLCVQAGVHPHTATKYKNEHPEMRDEDIIIRYNPNCYINIQGELVIPKQ